MKKLAITYESTKRTILLFLALMIINYSFNSIFNFDYLLPLNLAALTGLYLLMHFLFPQKFQLTKEDMVMIFLILYSLVHSLFFATYEYSLLVIGMSFIPYFLARFIILEDKDIDFFIYMFCILGIILLIVYYKQVGFQGVQGRFRIAGRHPVAIAGDFGMIAVSFSYVLFTAKRYWIKIVSLILLLGTLYITIFVLATRGASFTAMIAITYLYFTLSTGTLKDKMKRFFLIFLCLAAVFLVINNEFVIANYPMLERFTLKGILEDPSVTGDRRFTGRKWFALRSFEIILRSSFFGEGLGVIYSHNLFLEWISSLGLVGFIPLLVFLFLIFIKVFKMRNSNSRFNLLFTMMIYSFVLRLVSFSMISHKSFFIICGLMVSYYYTSINNTEDIPLE